MTSKILRLNDVIAKTGLSRSTIYRLEKENRFPARVSLSSIIIGWHEEDINQWIEGLKPKSKT